MNRPDIPNALVRQVKMEAGHRCAIPTCKQTPIEIAHIVPWSTMHEHVFENLIALCPTCHSRYDRDEIDRPSMKRYKTNLAVINGRYGDMERRVLQYFVDNPDKDQIILFGGLDFFLSYLLKDGLIIDTGYSGNSIGDEYMNVEMVKIYAITSVGKEFIRKWKEAQDLI